MCGCALIHCILHRDPVLDPDVWLELLDDFNKSPGLPVCVNRGSESDYWNLDYSQICRTGRINNELLSEGLKNH